MRTALVIAFFAAVLGFGAMSPPEPQPRADLMSSADWLKAELSCRFPDVTFDVLCFGRRGYVGVLARGAHSPDKQAELRFWVEAQRAAGRLAAAVEWAFL